MVYLGCFGILFHRPFVFILLPFLYIKGLCFFVFLIQCNRCNIKYLKLFGLFWHGSGLFFKLLAWIFLRDFLVIRLFSPGSGSKVKDSSAWGNPWEPFFIMHILWGGGYCTYLKHLKVQGLGGWSMVYHRMVLWGCKTMALVEQLVVNPANRTVHQCIDHIRLLLLLFTM